MRWLQQRVTLLPRLMMLVVLFTSTLVAQQELTGLVKKIQKSVLTLNTFDERNQPLKTGTGFLVDAGGRVVTSRHILMGASRAEAKTSNGSRYRLRSILAEDVNADLIKVSLDSPAPSGPSLPIADALPEIGERIVVLGNPLGLEQTLSDGIVSAVRDIGDSVKMVQITAPVSPGSSGSPVVNMRGQVVGIVALQAQEGQNLNLAVASRRIVALKGGEARSLAQWANDTAKENKVLAETLYSKGMASKEDGKYEQGLIYFERAVARDPSHGDAWLGLCECRNRAKGREEALMACQKAIFLAKDFVTAHTLLAGVYIRMNRWDEAEQVYEMGGVLHSNSVEMLKNQAAFHTIRSHHDKAAIVYKRIVELMPNDLEAHNNLGGEYEYLAKWRDAADSFMQSIRLDPGNGEAHRGLGFAYLFLGRVREGVEELKLAVQISPDYPRARYQLGGGFLMLGDKASALEQYKILKRDQSNDAEALFKLIYQ